MRQIFIISFLLIQLGYAAAQNNVQDSLLFYEYLFFKTTDPELRHQCLLKKVNVQLREGSTSIDVFNDVKRIKADSLTDLNLRLQYVWNASLISYLNDETDYANFYLARYQQLSLDTTIELSFLSALINRYSDTAAFNKHLRFLNCKDSLFVGLNCFMDPVNYHRKHRNFFLISSALVPGLGTAMNGYVLKGLLSLAITGASVYGIVKMVEYGLYLNAVLWGSGVGLKFYIGNIRLTDISFDKAEERKKNKLASACELKLQLLIQKYPFTLKGL